MIDVIQKETDPGFDWKSRHKLMESLLEPGGVHVHPFSSIVYWPDAWFDTLMIAWSAIDES